MLPFLFEAGTAAAPIRVPTYGAIVLLAFVAGFLLANLRARRVGVTLESLAPLFAVAAAGGLLGARVLYMIAVEPAQTLAHPLSIFSVTGGGLAFYGGVLGGGAGVVIAAAAKGLPGWKIVDVLAPGLALGLGIGRLACFCAGCCHGAAVHLGEAATSIGGAPFDGRLWFDGQFPWIAVEFGHKGVARVTDVPLYPTQLWSVVAGGLLAAALTWKSSRRGFDGQIVGLYLVVEPIARFVIESFRADDRGYVLTWMVDRSTASWLPPGFTQAGDQLPGMAGAVLAGVTTSQFIGLAMIAVGIAILITRRRKGVAPETPLAEEF